MNNTLPLLIPAAGYGSRLFPVTWGIPKELFPLGNKPALHYLLEEAICANINNIICVTSSRKESLIKYLNYKQGRNDFFLNFEESSKLACLSDLNDNFTYDFVVQEFALGVGNAILCAEKFLLKNDFFCMAYPDDILIDFNRGLNFLIKMHKKYNCSIIALEKVEIEKISLYGVISYKNELEKGVFEISNIIEKPQASEAPSNYAIIGRYLISNKILNYLKNQNNVKACFIKALNDFIYDGNKIIAVELESIRYDIGTVIGWIEAINAINNIKENNLKIE